MGQVTEKDGFRLSVLVGEFRIIAWTNRTPMSRDATLKQAIFEAALHLPTPEERRSYLDRVCGDNPELRHGVEAPFEIEISETSSPAT